MAVQRLLYNLFLLLYKTIVSILSLFNNKAKLWIKGRQNIFLHLASTLKNEHAEKIWVHCASLGEFEQAIPFIEAIKKLYASKKIVLTFFSPSGYEVQKNYSGVDFIFYMPLDSAKNAKHFYNIVSPKLVVFIKYDFWFYYLNEASKRKIPLLLISGAFRSNQPFFKWYGNFHRSMLQCFTHLFVQNEWCLQLLQTIKIRNVSVSGDTRFERVLIIAENFQPVTAIDNFINKRKVIVAGSTWSEDDEALAHFTNTHADICFIIAPHDISEERLKECEKLYNKSIRYSTFKQNNLQQQSNNNVLIIDNIGMLKTLYGYADICFIGGGFGGDGVHNVLEAAVYNKPVLFGPVYDKYIEAIELIEEGGAFVTEDALKLERKINELLNDKVAYKTAAVSAGNYVHSKTGATSIITGYIQENRLLIN